MGYDYCLGIADFRPPEVEESRVEEKKDTCKKCSEDHVTYVVISYRHEK